MSLGNHELTLMSDEELEARLHAADGPAADKAKVSYQGKERRAGEERRVGDADRRAMVRFEPEKGQTDRRSGRDRRKNTRADDLWERRDF